MTFRERGLCRVLATKWHPRDVHVVHCGALEGVRSAGEAPATLTARRLAALQLHSLAGGARSSLLAQPALNGARDRPCESSLARLECSGFAADAFSLQRRQGER